MPIRSANLSFRDPVINSDKVYHLSLEPVEGSTSYPSSDDGYVVIARYGRRGGTLQMAEYGPYDTQWEAEEVYNRKLREKLSKGYVEDVADTLVRRIMSPAATLKKSAPDYYVVPDEEEI